MAGRLCLRSKRLLVVALCAVLMGCSATVTHQVEDSNSTGIRYYRNAPYLLIYSDGKGGLKWQIIYLPDQSQIMTATPSVVGGHTEMTLFFQNGALASSSVIGDTTALPRAIIAAVQSALPLMAMAAAGQQQPGFPAPFLYKIVLRDNVVNFVGGQGDSSIQVPINGGS